MKALIDTFAFCGFILTQIFHFMPEIAATLTAIWYAIRIFEYFLKKNK